jgi:hypothetical protein
MDDELSGLKKVQGTCHQEKYAGEVFRLDFSQKWPIRGVKEQSIAQYWEGGKRGILKP